MHTFGVQVGYCQVQGASKYLNLTGFEEAAPLAVALVRNLLVNEADMGKMLTQPLGEHLRLRLHLALRV